MKKKGKKADTADDGAKPKSGGKLLGVLAPVAVFGASFGASYLKAPEAPPPAAELAAEETQTVADVHSSDWKPPKPALTLPLDPLTITAGAEGQVLKIGLALELWDRNAEIDSARLRDAFTAYLRAVDPEQLANPSFHMRLKRALLHRARVVSGQDVVADILITDFLLTS